MAKRREQSQAQAAQEDVPPSSQVWRSLFSSLSRDFDFFSAALRRVRAGGAAEREEAISYLEAMVASQVLASGFPLNHMIAVESAIKSSAFYVFALLDSDASIETVDEARISRVISDVISSAPMKHEAWVKINRDQNAKLTKGPIVGEEHGPVATEDMDNVTLNLLYHDTASLLKERLCDLGLSEELSAHVARNIMADFRASRSTSRRTFATITDAKMALDFAFSVIRGLGIPVGEALQHRVADAFGEAAKVALPERAPAVWENRKDRLPGETPIEFIQRVWGPWMKAGVLYQDMIGKLGDTKLVKAIRTYCYNHKIDASSVLPPPRKVRTERALAQAGPGSSEARVLRRTISVRDASAASRAARRNPKPGS